jgi:hypothetical protein
MENRKGQFSPRPKTKQQNKNQVLFPNEGKMDAEPIKKKNYSCFPAL